jgi:hypothetical protein
LLSSYLPFQIDKIKIVLGHSTFDALTITMTMAMMAPTFSKEADAAFPYPAHGGQGNPLAESALPHL